MGVLRKTRKAKIRQKNAETLAHFFAPTPPEALEICGCADCGELKSRYVYGQDGLPDWTTCAACGPHEQDPRLVIDYGQDITVSFACIEHDVWLRTSLFANRSDPMGMVVERRLRLGSEA